MRTMLLPRLIAIYCCLIFATYSIAQSVAINNDGTFPDSSAILDVKSDSRGALFPRMTISQRESIANPAQGLLVYQTDSLDGFYYFDGISWLRLWNQDSWKSADYDSGWLTMTSQSGAASFMELTHNFGSYPSRVKVLTRPTSGVNSGFIFEGMGAAQGDDDDDSNYGGVIFAYDLTKIRLWAPDRNNHSSNGHIINIYDGWGGETNSQWEDSAQVRVLLWK